MIGRRKSLQYRKKLVRSRRIEIECDQWGKDGLASGLRRVHERSEREAREKRFEPQPQIS